ncbi:tetratricopeptide repeat protein [Niveibacterium microcysteis]|uniref:Sel1 repeat family protein n=1 Tax=Niveibacterium microcysteis TaxID=2811415 RepID=A0ABX7M8K6_9RHOO|nr:SEL1-like repeat protein [Niveibacterium microcysteis]QSI78038.1 sel1 repeat family protein [Niveibacterium microcysteis]
MTAAAVTDQLRARPGVLKALAGVALAAALAGLLGAAWTHHAARTPAPAAIEALAQQAGAGRDDDALQRLRLLAAPRDAAMSQRALGEALLARNNTRDSAEGIAWLEKAASQGDADAHMALGKLQFLGSPYVERDYPSAYRHFAAAGAQGHAGAAYYLGLMLRSGYGVRENRAAAARWFALAAAKQSPAAMFMLANAYRDGDGVPRDERRARELYEEAAELELPEAIQTLAMAYRNGELGLPKDEMQARHFSLETAHALKHPALVP